MVVSLLTKLTIFIGFLNSGQDWAIGKISTQILKLKLCIFVLAIGNAYAILSNTEKRKQYDQRKEEFTTFRTSHADSSSHYREFEADITPEDVFNMFFGGRFPTGWYYNCAKRLVCT